MSAAKQRFSDLFCNLTCPNGTYGHNSTLHYVAGLGMTPTQYNLLYAIYAWINAVVVILAGFLIDKLRNHFGVFVFSLLTVLGSSIFALGSHFKGSPYFLPMTLTGRLLFGSGNGSLTLVQNCITSFWFKGKELALAFGPTLSFSCLGSVLNFFTQQFESWYGMQWTLWGGTLLYVLGFVSALTVSVLDKVGMKQLGLDGLSSKNPKWIRGKANKAFVVGVRYRLPNQDEETDEAFDKQLAEIAQLPALLMGTFNCPDTCWKYNAALREQLRRFLERVEDSLLTQLLGNLLGGAPPDLLYKNREGLVGGVVVGSCLGQSDHDYDIHLYHDIHHD
ncbi:LOW QUALITY PROTEIN: uncharacterized protein V3H86_009322 [Mergus octosetaceus]